MLEKKKVCKKDDWSYYGTVWSSLLTGHTLQELWPFDPPSHLHFQWDRWSQAWDTSVWTQPSSWTELTWAQSLHAGLGRPSSAPCSPGGRWSVESSQGPTNSATRNTLYKAMVTLNNTTLKLHNYSVKMHIRKWGKWILTPTNTETHFLDAWCPFLEGDKGVKPAENEMEEKNHKLHIVQWKSQGTCSLSVEVSLKTLPSHLPRFHSDHFHREKSSSSNHEPGNPSSHRSWYLWVTWWSGNFKKWEGQPTPWGLCKASDCFSIQFILFQKIIIFISLTESVPTARNRNRITFSTGLSTTSGQDTWEANCGQSFMVIFEGHNNQKKKNFFNAKIVLVVLLKGS